MALLICCTMVIFVCLSERARGLGDYLVVAISTDEFNLGKGKVCAYSYEDRAHIVKAIRYVDEVIPESRWEQKIVDVKNHVICTLL